MTTDLSFLSLARLEEARQAGGTADVALESEAIGGGFMSYGGPGSWANQAAGLGLSGPVSEEELDRLVHFFVSRGVVPKIEVCAFADRSLISGLAARGFLLQEFETVFARRLSPEEDLRALLPKGWPAGLTFAEVEPEDERAVDSFVEASNRGFFPPEQMLTPALLETTRRVVRHPRCRSFFALLDGALAGTATLEIHPPLAALIGATVRPAYRCRGIQSAMMVHRMSLAAQKGCAVAIVHSHPEVATGRNAVRLGFFMAYAKAVMVRPQEGLLPSP